MSFGATTYSHWVGSGRRDWLIDVTTTCPITNGPVSNIVDGFKANNNGDGVYCDSAQSGREFKFAFPFQVRIDEFTWTQDAAGTQGTWKIAGSNDDSTYTDLGTGINLGGASAVDVHAFTNTNGYSYYKLIQTAGTTTNTRWIQEIEFKVSLDSDFGGDAVGATSYANQDGTGNRTSRMLVILNTATACGGGDVGNMNSVVNGVTGVANCTDATAFVSSSSNEIKICFREPLAIDAFTWKQQTIAGHGTWKIAASPDDVSYTDLGSGFAIGAGSTSEEFTFTNTTGYNFYKLIQTGGTTNVTPWVYEIEFKTSLVAPASVTPHNFVAGTAIEVLSDSDGSAADVAGTALEVLSDGDGSTAFAAGVALEVLSSVALAPKRAFDGGKIYEISFGFQPETIYSESDWDSIYSIGDRLGNGTLVMTQGGWAATTGDVTQLIDYNWGLSGGNGFGVNGQSGWPTNGYVAWATGNGEELYISGFRNYGSAGGSWDGLWSHFGGFDGEVWGYNSLEFSTFTNTRDGSGVAQFEYTPSIIAWNYWTFSLVPLADGVTDDFGGANIGPELMFKVYHSVLDGGDRRPSNGRAIKRVIVSVSSGIVASAGFGVDALENLVDGQYANSNGGPNPPTGKSPATTFTRVGGTSGDDEVTAPGEYIQFSFPRKVFMREMVWEAGEQETLGSGGEPQKYGLWQWQASNASGSGYIDVGDPWHFLPGSYWMKSPKARDEGLLPPIEVVAPGTPWETLRYTGDPIDFSYPYWRMVLVEGPAFGTGNHVFQIQFNLIDPNNQVPLNEAAFSDGDSDALSASPTIVVADPTKQPLSDGDSDVLTATPTVVNNFDFTMAMSDGDSDRLTSRSSLDPSIVVQTIAIVKGR